MAKYKFLEHTADVFIQGSGKTLEEAFANTALGLNAYMIGPKNVAKKVEKKISVSSEDEKALLFDFLGQFLIFKDAEDLAISDVNVQSIKKTPSGFTLKATAKGEPFDPKKHEEGTHIKAITYHDMQINKQKNTYVVTVLVDI